MPVIKKKTCNRCGKDMDEKYKHYCASCREELDSKKFESREEYREYMKTEFEERWKPKFEQMNGDGVALIDTGKSLADMGEILGLTRERVRQIIKGLDMSDRYKKARNKHKPVYKCAVCGVDVPRGRKYCKEHSPMNKENSVCPSCGEVVEPGDRIEGKCQKCYFAERETEACFVCGNTKGRRMFGACSKCYIRVRKRIENETPVEKWRSKNKKILAAEKELYDRIKKSMSSGTSDVI